jgi:hypothetical protein
MAKKLPVKKAAAKKIAVAVKKKAPAAKTASQPKAKAAAAKPAPKAASKPAAKPAPKPAPKAAAKPAPKPAPKTAPQPTPQSLPAPVKAPAPAPAPAPEFEFEMLEEAVPVPEALPVAISKSYSPPASTKFPASPLALSMSAQSSAGAAANGNTHPANILVIVTCGGSPVTDLSRDHFTLMEHFDVPGQMAPFSNNITSFRNAGTGAYLLQTKPITGAPWRSGHHLAQILVSTPDDHQGQVAVKIVIR